MDRITIASTVRARSANPETGEEAAIGAFPNTGTGPFTTPKSWSDAVLPLDAVRGG